MWTGLVLLSHSIFFFYLILGVRSWNFFLDFWNMSVRLVLMNPIDNTEKRSVILLEMVFLSRRIFSRISGARNRSKQIRKFYNYDLYLIFRSRNQTGTKWKDKKEFEGGNEKVWFLSNSLAIFLFWANCTLFLLLHHSIYFDWFLESVIIQWFLLRESLHLT